MKNSCEDQLQVQCDIFDYLYENSVTYNSNCLTIGSLFDEWFTYNNYNNIKTDFYLETPFTKGNIRRNTSTKEQIKLRRSQPNYLPKSPSLVTIRSTGWIQSMEDFFHDCIIRQKKDYVDMVQM